MEHRYFDAFVLDNEPSDTIDMEHEVLSSIMNDPEDEDDEEWDDLELDVQPQQFN